MDQGKQLAYSVWGTFSGARAKANSDAWVNWLQNEHIAEVLKCGAERAEIVRWDGEDTQVQLEIRYWFRDRADFQRYERDEAPRLRAEGLRRFPPADFGLSFRRATGEILS